MLLYRHRPLCSLDSHLKNAKMLRHTPNPELLFLLIEKGSEAKNWAQCPPRGFIAALQAKLQGEPEERWPIHREATAPKPHGSQGGGNWNTSSSKARAEARDGKRARERPSKSPFLKSFRVNIIANLSLCTFQAHSWSSCS